MFWAFARNPLHAEEQTPVLFLGELLPLVYTMYMISSFPNPFLRIPPHHLLIHAH